MLCCLSSFFFVGWSDDLYFFFLLLPCVASFSRITFIYKQNKSEHERERESYEKEIERERFDFFVIFLRILDCFSFEFVRVWCSGLHWS